MPAGDSEGRAWWSCCPWAGGKPLMVVPGVTRGAGPQSNRVHGDGVLSMPAASEGVFAPVTYDTLLLIHSCLWSGTC